MEQMRRMVRSVDEMAWLVGLEEEKGYMTTPMAWIRIKKVEKARGEQ